MLTVNEIKTVKKMKKDWYAFKYERNMPKYQGVTGPHWMTMLEREGMIETLLSFCFKSLRD